MFSACHFVLKKRADLCRTFLRIFFQAVIDALLQLVAQPLHTIAQGV
jgi:hypothetical protein